MKVKKKIRKKARIKKFVFKKENRIEAIVKNINSKFNAFLIKHFSSIDDEIRSIKSEIAELKMELKKKADLNRLESLEKRVRKLETSNVKLRALAMQPKS